jgi:ATP-binding cassette subfamily F protein uup
VERARKQAPQPATPNVARVAAPRAKLSFKEARELAALPDRIAALEQEQAAIALRLTDAALYRDDPSQAKRLQAKLAQIEADLAACLARWEELESRNAAMPAPVK